MKKTTTILTVALAAGIMLMGLQTASAQEWRALIDKNIFTTAHPTQTLHEKFGEENDWLATQTPLLKNTPISSANTKRKPLRTQTFESEFSNIGSWSPLQTETGKENFTLFSF